MQYEKIGLNEIVPSDYNPRKMTPSQLEKLEKNMQTFGLVDPIIINLKNNHIIGGHQRFSVLFDKYSRTDEGAIHQLNLIRLGDIGWVFEDTELTVKDDNHEKMLNLSLNRLDGEFDDEATAHLISQLTEAQMDMDLSGFEDYEVIEYTLDDFELSLADNDEFLEEDNDQENNTSVGNVESYSTTIHFHTQQERTIFIQWLGKLREQNPEQKISEIILKALQSLVEDQPKCGKAEPYYILHVDMEEKQAYDELLQLIENNPYNQTTPIIKLIQNDQ